MTTINHFCCTLMVFFTKMHMTVSHINMVINNNINKSLWKSFL